MAVQSYVCVQLQIRYHIQYPGFVSDCLLYTSYADFVGLLRSRVNAAGHELIVALAPKTSATQPGALYEGHDYKLLGEQADAVLLMT